MIVLFSSGHSNVKETVADFLSKRLQTVEPLLPENITFQAGKIKKNPVGTAL